MRVLFAVMFALALVLAGCTSRKAAPPTTNGSPHAGTGASRSEAGVTGQVLRVDPVGRFVVLGFPRDQIPVMDQRLKVYRQGAKVAEVKVTNWQRGHNLVADIVTGAPEVGAEARTD
jgi:hypothetical protein